MTTITVDRAVLEQALEALESLFTLQADDARPKRCGDAITALRAALAQQEQEQEPPTQAGALHAMKTVLWKQGPVAWVDEASIAWLAEHPRGIITTRLVKQKSPERQMAMYAEPPRREWQSLCEEEIADAQDAAAIQFRKSRHGVRGQQLMPSDSPDWWLARAIEAALKEKNA
jgi:hypothetical protein